MYTREKESPRNLLKLSLLSSSSISFFLFFFFDLVLPWQDNVSFLMQLCLPSRLHVVACLARVSIPSCDASREETRRYTDVPAPVFITLPFRWLLLSPVRNQHHHRRQRLHLRKERRTFVMCVPDTSQCLTHRLPLSLY